MDNARCHNCQVTLDVLNDYEWNRVPQAPYSPDLSPCDFFLFDQLKRPLRGVQFQAQDEMCNAVTKRLAELAIGGFRNVFLDWVERHRKCVAARGDYFE